MSQGKPPVACREAGISQQSYSRWRKEYGGLELDHAKRMKELERENVRLKRLVADLSLEKQVLTSTRYVHTRRSAINLWHRRHPQPTCFNWIRVLPCSSLYPAGPKYPLGHATRRLQLL